MKSLFKVLSTLVILLSFVAPVSADVQSLSEISNAFQVSGDLPFANNAGAKPARLAIGTTGQVLVVGSNGFPSWSSSPVISGLTGPVTLNPGPLLIPNALSAINQGINLGISAGSTDIGTTALQIFDSAGQDQAYLVQGSADAIPARLIFAKSRKTDGTADTIVANADVIGRIRFMGADGAAFRTAAQILASVDGAPGSSDMPGSLDFQVTPDGSATPASALKLVNSKNAVFGGSILPAVDGDNTNSNVGSGSFGMKNIYLSDATNRAQFLVSNGLYASYPTGQSMFFREASTDRWSIKATSGDFASVASGNTLAIQEATAGSACSGTLTANGASDVVTSTTCATTGSRILLTRTSALTAALAEAYVKSISTGVSFTTNAVATNTSTYNWFIIHEAP